MRALAPYASLAVVAWVVGCSGFTEIGEGAGRAGMGAAGSGDSGGSGATSGKGGTGGASGSATGGSSEAGSDATGGTAPSGGTGAQGGSGTTGGSGGSAGGKYEPCAGKACGATCTQCAPDDPTCAETANIKYCDRLGACGSSFPECGGTGGCTSAGDCPSTNVACTSCPDGTSACPTVDCVNGTCVNSFPTCASTECKVDSECPHSLAPCQLCADGTSACPWAKCVNGVCTAGIDTCDGTDPCAGKACGDYCTTCVEGSGCIAVAQFCDENLKCQVNRPSCSASECSVDTDCATEVCGRCANTTDCAVQVCVDGTCTFKCPDDPCGGCVSPEICIYQIGGPGPSHYVCAEQLPCGAAAACACIPNQGTCQPEKIDGYCQCDNGLE